MVRRPGGSAKGFDYPSLFDGLDEIPEESTDETGRTGEQEVPDLDPSAGVSGFSVPSLEAQLQIADPLRGDQDAPEVSFQPDALPTADEMPQPEVPPAIPLVPQLLDKTEQAPATAIPLPPDWYEREQALDVSRSWIVEAPAGSGKTGLLIQRCLKLLAAEDVTRPEQVLAITFTRLATEEIRDRLMEALRTAAAGEEIRSEFDRETRSLALSVLRQDAALGWGLLRDPRRLNVRTIDSVCEEIARSLPLLSGGGGGLRPTEDAGRYYREAARRTLLELGGPDHDLTLALENLLLHRDGNLGTASACSQTCWPPATSGETWSLCSGRS